jgi:hypothetical protein
VTYSLSASGHTGSEADEAALIADLRIVFGSEYSGASAATIYTSHHGTVNLMEPVPDLPATEPGRRVTSYEPG